MVKQAAMVSINGSSVTMDSGALRLDFSTTDYALVLSGVSGSGVEHLDAEAGDISLWRIAFESLEGESVEVGSGDVSLAEVVPGEDRMEFSWRPCIGEDRAVVTASIRMEESSPLSHWSLRAELPEGWKVTRANFPVIPSIRLREGLKMAVPAGWGLEYGVRPGTSFAGTYPSCLAAMQFAAFYAGGHGLYIGAHDPDANHKQLDVKTSEEASSFTVVNWPAIPENSGGVYELPYEAAVGVFAGDYYDAAQIYREFTFHTPWGQAGPVSERDIPEWLTETDLWLRPDGSAEANVGITKKALEYFGVRTSLHWYRWHEIPYDTLYPEYFPPLPGFAEGIETVQDAGAPVMPYINGRLCDPNSKTWNEEKGHESAARDEKGEPYTELYGSKVPLNVMCPFTDQWREKVKGLVHRLIDECGVSGVYIDQIGAAYPVRCFNPNHGHPVGGGDFWHYGYRRMLDEIREDLPEGIILTTEENAECWIDQFDALLLVNTPTNDATPIPLFPAVYSGRTLNFGFLYYPQDDIERSLPFILKTARAFIFGAQPGWIQPSRIMAPDAAKEAKHLRTIARTRRFAHNFVTYGRLLGLLEIGGDNPRVTGEGSGSFSGTYPINVPSVMASAWLAEDGKLGVLLANISEEPREVEFALPIEKAGLEDAAQLTTERFGPEGIELTETSGSAVQKLIVPGLGAVVVSCRAT